MKITTIVLDTARFRIVRIGNGAEHRDTYWVLELKTTDILGQDSWQEQLTLHYSGFSGQGDHGLLLAEVIRALSDKYPSGLEGSGEGETTEKTLSQTDPGQSKKTLDL